MFSGLLNLFLNVFMDVTSLEIFRCMFWLLLTTMLFTLIKSLCFGL